MLAGLLFAEVEQTNRSRGLLMNRGRRYPPRLCQTLHYKVSAYALQGRAINPRKEIVFSPNNTMDWLTWCTANSANWEALRYWLGVAVIALGFALMNN